MSNTRKCHISLPILVGDGKLILDAGTAHPEISPSLGAHYLRVAVVVWAPVEVGGVDQ